MHYHRSIQEVCINWLAWLTRERFFQRNRLSAVWYTWYNEAWHKRDKKNRAKTALFHPVLHSGTHTKATYRDIGQPLVSNNTSRLSNWFASKSDCHGQLEKPILLVRLVIVKLHLIRWFKARHFTLYPWKYWLSKSGILQGQIWLFGGSELVPHGHRWLMFVF